MDKVIITKIALAMTVGVIYSYLLIFIDNYDNNFNNQSYSLGYEGASLSLSTTLHSLCHLLATHASPLRLRPLRSGLPRNFGRILTL